MDLRNQMKTNKEIAEEICRNLDWYKSVEDSLIFDQGKLERSIERELDAKDARIKVLEDALSFYADKRSWTQSIYELISENAIRRNIGYEDVDNNVAGKRAREALGE